MPIALSFVSRSWLHGRQTILNVRTCRMNSQDARNSRHGLRIHKPVTAPGSPRGGASHHADPSRSLGVGRRRRRFGCRRRWSGCRCGFRRCRSRRWFGCCRRRRRRIRCRGWGRRQGCVSNYRERNRSGNRNNDFGIHGLFLRVPEQHDDGFVSRFALTGHSTGNFSVYVRMSPHAIVGISAIRAVCARRVRRRKSE